MITFVAIVAKNLLLSSITGIFLVHLIFVRLEVEGLGKEKRFAKL